MRSSVDYLSDETGGFVKEKELPVWLGPVLLWSLSAAFLAHFLFRALVLRAAETYSYQLFLDLNGASMANPRWQPWWGATLFRWACFYAAVIHGILVGAMTYIVVTKRIHRKQGTAA
ncbi:hypothetical protein [uncultured Gimesia sp.]|uniref:hypothetical protein n=1 Tax=uncultured Gimesia sp. TaxID=1678688 RepID=UPI0030D98C4E